MAQDADNLARLTSVRTEMEAGVIVSNLEERGIQATMSGIHTANFRAEAPGWVEVLVAENALPQAKEVLEEARSQHDDIDWSQVDVGEPEETNVNGTNSWWMPWRRLCYALVVLYLIYEVALLSGFIVLRIFGPIR